MTHQELVRGCIKKEPSAWNEFVERFSKLIWWAIETRLNRFTQHYTREDIEEIYQNVFVSIWEKEKLKSLKDNAKLDRWLCAVSSNMAVDYIRQTKTDKGVLSLFEPIGQEEETILLQDCIASDKDCPAEAASAGELRSVLEGLLLSLSHREKTIITFNLLYDKTHQEISDILNMPINTVSTVIKRTKERLRDKLTQMGFKDF